jgi:hypothetical protein
MFLLHDSQNRGKPASGVRLRPGFETNTSRRAVKRCAADRPVLKVRGRMLHTPEFRIISYARLLPKNLMFISVTF